jgi:hypothetical protein
MTDYSIEKLLYDLKIKFLEVVTILFFAFVIIFSIFIKRWAIAILTKLGFNYFQERQIEISSIVSDVIELKGYLKADYNAFYRIYEKKHYVSELTDKVKSNIVHTKPKNIFPENIEKEFPELIKIGFSIDRTLISYEYLKRYHPNSKLISFYDTNRITFLLLHRITNYSDRNYGLLIFAWNENIDYYEIYDSIVSMKFDSINNRFYPFVESSILEKLGVRTL